MSMCDNCFQPGECCKSLFLRENNGEPIVFWEGEDKDLMAARGLPFELAEIHERWVDDDGRPFVTAVWNCPKLDPATGRCTIYENRPLVCRSYEPGQDALCVHFQPLENSELV